MKPIVIFGVGLTAKLVHSAPARLDRDVVGFTVDRALADPAERYGLPVVPFDEVVDRWPPRRYDMFVAVGYARVNKFREEKYQAAKELGYTLPSYVGSKATVWPELEIGDNCFIMEHNVIQPFARIGSNVIMWSGSHVGHESEVGDHLLRGVPGGHLWQRSHRTQRVHRGQRLDPRPGAPGPRERDRPWRADHEGHRAARGPSRHHCAPARDAERPVARALARTGPCHGDPRPPPPVTPLGIRRCATPADVYHLPASRRSAAFTREASRSRSTWWIGQRSLLLPVIVRALPNGSGCDAASPYGYPGPVAVAATTRHSSMPPWAPHPGAAGDGWGHPVVRLHPLLNAVTPPGIGQVVDRGVTVGIDLTVSPEEEAWRQTRENHQRGMGRCGTGSWRRRPRPTPICWSSSASMSRR